MVNRERDNMDKKQEKQYAELIHRWTDHIYSMDISNLPDFVKREFGISEREHQVAASAAFCQVQEGMLMVNESLNDWKAIRNLLFALDTLPHAMLEDIYKMESERYKDMQLDISHIDEPGEKIRQLLYLHLIPTVLQSHKISDKQHI